MMKFLFFYISLIFLLIKNKFINFYYNLLFLISLMFMLKFNNNMDFLFYSMNLYFMLDYYSFMLILLSIWIISLMLMTLNFFNYLKIMMFLIMMIILFLVFSMKNLLLFYFFFELSLIPIFMIVIYWGYNPERMSAAYYMLMYTMFISLPLLIYIMMIFLKNNNLDFSLLILDNKYKYLTLWSFLIITGSFLIKLPMFLFHIWLPKAHVEAPVYGSMILAAILLKLGGYGLMRILMIFLENSIKFSNLLISMGMIGSLIISLICFMQIDMKSMVAYSSIVHMNLMLCSLLTLSKMGFLSAYMIMISHGLCSSGLFYMVNLYYYRSSSRLMLFNKGMINILSMYSMWWFFLCCSNFSFPLSFSFFSEIMLLTVLINWNFNIMYLLILINFFSSLYSLYLYSFIQHGNLMILNKFNSGKMKEIKVIYLHYYPLLMILFNMNLF